MPSSPADPVPRLKRLLPRLKGKRIGVLGDLMLDRYLWGTATRLSPEAAVPVVDFVEQSECLGGAGNVAANLAALGARVEAFGAVGGEKGGDDEPGRALRACLRAAAIGDDGVIADPKRITTVKTRIIARHQQVVRVDRERREPLRKETEEKLVRRLLATLGRLDALVLSDYDKGLITDVPATSFDVTYARVGQPGVERGATGRQVFDRTGAGDTVLSTLALAVAAGASLPDAAVLANAAAGVVVGKLGTATVSAQELAAALSDLRHS